MAIETQSIANESTASDGSEIKSFAIPFDNEEAQAKEAAVKVEEDSKKASDEAAAAVEAAKAKPEKTEAEREFDRLQRGIDRQRASLTRMRAAAEQAKAEAAAAKAEAVQFQQGLTKKPAPVDNEASDESESLTLTRAELDEYVEAQAKARAEKLAPALVHQSAEAERQKGILKVFTDKLGGQPATDPKYENRFDEVAAELDLAFQGLRDGDNKLKPAMSAVLEADDPVAVATWLADVDNSDEAERISKLSDVQAGKAIAKLEFKLEAEAKEHAAARATEKAKAKPIPSQVPAPLESVRGQGVIQTAPDPSNTKAWMAWRNAQARKGI